MTELIEEDFKKYDKRCKDYTLIVNQKKKDEILKWQEHSKKLKKIEELMYSDECSVTGRDSHIQFALVKKIQKILNEDSEIKK